MSSLNPYAKFLSGEVKSSVAATPAKLRAVVARMDEAKLTRSPAPGKWSPTEVLCHLADTELAFSFRLRQGLAEPHHVIQPFDQDRWAGHYRRLKAHDALEAFCAFRQWNLLLLAAVDEAAWAKPISHPERGEMKLSTVLETMAGHDENHLQQLEAMAK